MGKSTAAGNVTAEEFSEPAVVRDALGRDHIVGPMANREQLEERLDEIDAPKVEPKIDEKPADEKPVEPVKPVDGTPKSASQRTGTSSTK